ncbi:MAG: hypothetical protein ABIQ04_04115 [Candidatus Saccharimonadales bacterium]
MQKRRLVHYVKQILTIAVIVSGTPGIADAQTATSNNYQVTETQFGASSSSQNCSTQYCAQASIGDAGAGSAASSGTSAVFGPITNSDPLLEVIVDPGVSNLGVLTTESTATKTTTVQVRNYLSDGYILQIVGTPPKYGNHTLSTPSTPVRATPGTEQFAINAATNTTPHVGADPIQVPSNQTSFGIATTDYRTADLFKYVSGDIVARSSSASGQTSYTISMIVNISNSTPAGHYSGDFSAVVIPVY